MEIKDLHPKTQSLIARMQKVAEWHGLDKEKAEKAILAVYDLHSDKIKKPNEVIWVADILDEKT